MTDDTEKKLAALEAQIAALQAKVDPPKSTFVPETDEQFRSRMHDMSERRQNTWMHPNAINDLVRAEPKGFMAGVVRDNRAPNHPGQIPRTDSGGGSVRSAGDGTGYVDPMPLGVPGGTQTQELIERQVNAALPHGPEWGKK